MSHLHATVVIHATLRAHFRMQARVCLQLLSTCKSTAILGAGIVISAL
jgi:hypothetical protein